MAISEFPVARCNDLARRHSFGSLRCRQWESVRDVAAARNRTIFPSNSPARIAVPMYVFPGGASFCGLSCYDAIKCDCTQLRWYYDMRKRSIGGRQNRQAGVPQQGAKRMRRRTRTAAAIRQSGRSTACTIARSRVSIHCGL